MIVVSNVDYFHFVPSNPCVAVRCCKRGDMEALAVAVYMGGGPSLMYAADAVLAYDEFAGNSAVSVPATG